MSIKLSSCIIDVQARQMEQIPVDLSLAILSDVFRDGGASVDDVGVAYVKRRIKPESRDMLGVLAQAHLGALGPMVSEELKAMPEASRPSLGRRTLERWLWMLGPATMSDLLGSRSTMGEELMRKWLMALGLSVHRETHEASLDILRRIDSGNRRMTTFNASKGK